MREPTFSVGHTHGKANSMDYNEGLYLTEDELAQTLAREDAFRVATEKRRNEMPAILEETFLKSASVGLQPPKWVEVVA